MRKQFFFKSMLCLILGLVCNVAWAQPQVSNAPSDGQWADNTTWFVMSTLSGYLYGSEFADNEGLLQLNKTKTNTAGEHLLWSIVEGENGKYYIYNKAKGANVVLGFYDATPSGNTRTYRAKFVSKDDSNYTTLFEIVRSQKSTTNQDYWCLRAPGTTKYWNRGNYLTYWDNSSATNDNGSAHMFVESDIVEGMEYEFTDNVGNSFTGTFTGMKSSTFVQPSYTGVDGATLSNLSCTESKFSATITFPFPVSKTDGVTNRTFIFTNAFTNGYRAYIYTDDSGKIVTKSTKNADYGYLPTSEDGEIQKWMWAIYPTLTNGKFTFQIKNISTEKFVPAAAEQTTTINVSETAGNFSWGACMSSGNGFYLSDKTNLFWGAGSSDPGPKDALIWNKTGNTHKGCNLEFTTPIYTALISVSDDTDIEYPSFRGIINYTVEENDIERPVISGILDEWITNVEWNNASCNVTVNYPFPVSTESGVTNKTMICSFASASYKWHADGLNLRTAKNVEPSLEKLNLYYWAIYPRFNNGSFGFVVKNVGTGKYIYSTSNENNHNPGVVTFADAGSVMTIEANNRFKLPTGKFLSLNSTNVSDGTEQFVGTHGAHGGCNIAFLRVSELDSYTITTGTTGYASGYTPIAVTIPNGVTVYTGKMITANKASIILNELTDATVIPANTAFVIKGVASTTYAFNKSNTAGSPVANNVIMGSADNVATSSISNGVVYTMQADGTFQKYTGETILGCNAYIKMPTGTTDPVSILDEDDFVSEATDFKEGGVYTFISTKGWMGAKQECDNVISTAKAAHNVTGVAIDAMFQWTVLKSTKGNYYLYNLGKKKFMGVESRNNTSVPFSDTPAGRKMSFKQSSSSDYPIMFSTDNASVVNHNGSYGDGLITWTGGWDNLADAGSNHQVTLVSSLTEAEVEELTRVIEAYDKQLYVTTQVEGSWNDNPNTHFGNVTATSTSGTLSAKLKTDPSKVMLDYDGLKETTISFTRAYRGFEFQGFKLGEQDLGKSFTLTEEQKASITEENPLVAKFTATEAVTLFYDDDEFSYRIPAIATTSTGRLIAVSDYRHCLDDIGLNRYGKGYRIDLVIRTSDDNGKTWSSIKTIAEGIDNSRDNNCAYGDAAIAVVGEEVIVMAVAGSVSYGNGSAGSETEPQKTSRLVRIYSANNGEDWVKEDITEKVYGYEGALYPNMYTAFFGSGRLAVDPNFNESGNARIYGSMLTQGNGNIVIYSDDKGLTWNKLGGQVANANEPKIEILPNGQILFSARRNGGRNFNVFTYTNKANNEGTWDNAVNGCDNEGNNGTNGETFLVDAKNARGENVKLLLQSQPVGGGTWDRANVSIWYKEISSAVDHDHTPVEIASGWTKGLQVSHQLSAYSAMSLQKDGKIAFFFEEAPCYRDNKDYGYSMVYIPLTIEEITKNKYFSPAAELPVDITVNMVLTDAQGNEYRQTIENTTLASIGESVPSYVTLGENDSYVPNQDGSYTYTNTVTLPFKVSNENGTYWHNMYWPTAGSNAPVYMGANTSGETYVRTFAYSDQQYGNSPLNTQANEGKISWALYSVDNRLSFVFKNKETGKYIKVTGVYNDDAQNVEFAEKADATCFGIEPDQGSYHGDYALKTQNTDFGGYLCATRSDYGYATNFLRSTGVGTDHQGAWVIFKEAPDFDALITEANDVLSWIGEGLGKYTVSESNTAIAETAKTEMQTPNMVTLNDLNTYKNLLEGATLNRPESGQFYRISYDFGNAGIKYLQGVASSVNKANQITPPVSYDGEKGAASIFYYSGSKLLSYTAGTYLREQDNYRGLQGVGVDGGNVTFGESSRAKGKYTIQIPYYLHANTTNSNYHSDHCSNDAGHDAHDHSIEPVTSLPFTFKEAALGYATFHAPVAVKLPEGVTAYVAQIVGERTLQMRKFMSENEEPVVVPANTPVMLYKKDVTADIQISLEIVEDPYSEEEVSEIGKKNSFVGTVAAENLNAEKDCYSLQKSTATEGDSAGMMGFFKKTSGTKGGFKAWLEITKSTSNARAFTIIFDGDDATGLKEALGLENENVEIYDLSGRRLDKPAKGVNVIGGKLVIK